jgi:D-alanyl-D-alanine carboxypeptidase
MRILLAFLFAAFVLLSGAARAAEGDAQETRALALLEVLPKPRPERLAFVQANFSPGLIQRRGLDELTGITADLHDDLGKARLVGVRAGGQGLELILQTANDDWFALNLRFDAEARIDGLGLRPTEAPDAGGPQGPVREAELGRAIAEYMDARVAKGFSGAVIVARGDALVYGAAAGRADRATVRPNTLDTPINLGSMNKMFTAVVIGKLVEQGKLGWDDKVGQHLKDWPIKRVRDEVTIAHLLSHRSGLKSYWTDEHEQRRTGLDTAAEYAALCDDQEPGFAPGAQFEYSNCGFAVLGLIAERVSGTDYYKLVRDWVYRPAGMVNSDHYDRDDARSLRAIGYLPDARDNFGMLAKRGSAAGGGYASANDLLRFARALRGGQLLEPETLKELTTPRAEMGGPGNGYGYGFGIIGGAARGGERFVGHNGGAPGISADFALFDSGWTVIVLSNHDRGAGPIAQRLQRMVGSRIRE